MIETQQRTIVGTFGSRLNLFRKAELMAKWIAGTANEVEKRDLFIYMLMKRVDTPHFLGREWFIDDLNCLYSCDRDGNIRPILAFDHSHAPLAIFTRDPDERKAVLELQSCFLA